MNSNGAGVWQYNAEAFTTPVSTYPLMSTTLVLAASSVGTSTGTFTIELWSNSASAGQQIGRYFYRQYDLRIRPDRYAYQFQI